MVEIRRYFGDTGTVTTSLTLSIKRISLLFCDLALGAEVLGECSYAAKSYRLCVKTKDRLQSIKAY